MSAFSSATPKRSRRRGARWVAAVATVGALVASGGHPASAAETRYQVRRGDTLSDIALRVGVSQQALAAANGISNRDLVYSGLWLRIPTGGSGAAAGQGHHRVTAGETLSHIAQRFGLSTATLAAANGLSNANLVIIGTVLAIPSAGSAGSSGSGSPSSGAGSGLPSRLRASPSRMALMPLFDRWAAEYGLPADLVKAVTWLESGWQQGVVSSTGAVGIGQLMPDTVTTMSDVIGLDLNPWVPEQNIRMSARYLRLLLDVTGGSTGKTLAGYYQGLASVERHGVYSETLAYAQGVMALRARFA